MGSQEQSTARTFHRLLVANRGEAAVRVARTCVRLGIEPVFALSSVDAGAAYAKGRQSVLLDSELGARAYLDAAALVRAAKRTRCSALHPGWGFLAEDPLLATLCEAHGVTFVGPPAHVLHGLGHKLAAKAAMLRAGLRCVPGSSGLLTDAEHARQQATRVGYPVMLKAECGGGGRGMRRVQRPEQLEAAFRDAQAEARAAFGDDGMYLERAISGGRHIEVQVLADRYGNVIELGERDCTVQRKHQKLIEESPAPTLSPEARSDLLAATVRAVAGLGYVGAGTVEFLMDDNGELYFMEMNARLQVEHPVTEMRTGVDLVAAQIRVAAGACLGLSQEDVQSSGHVIECRINAEDPDDAFRPQPGQISNWAPPELGSDTRLDTHVDSGYEVSPFYDSMLAKLIVRGQDRQDAVQRMLNALEQLRCDGLTTNVAFHRAALKSQAFASGDYDTNRLPGWPPDPVSTSVDQKDSD